ncbi:MAG: hypothetical protein QOD51_2390 [Candidatus Eremiobacteraeota bacterium]|jgi:hypothetical protein|nr:hypothetical protein [Candidatus Eremiobacteraeota bacterium]
MHRALTSSAVLVVSLAQTVLAVPDGGTAAPVPRQIIAQATTAPATEPPRGVLLYRGFTVDAAAIEGDAGARSALEHQLDVVADCGVSPDILAFFRAQHIVVRPGARDRFSRNGGIEVDTRLPQQQPIVLHELLHAYHAFMLPQGARNPDIIGFYDEARNGGLYPARSYVLVNPMEFFAVTGSLYLSGHVDRPPGDRETLRARQPRYYAWLGQLFGVAK